MRGVIWLVLLFMAAVVAATTLGPNDGLVSIYWSGWRFDLSLNLFVIALLVAGVIALLAAQTIVTLLTLPRRAAQWRALRRERAANAALREALAEFFSARYSRAHKAAQRAVALHADDANTDREFGVLAHTLAAGSLHRLMDRPRRDEEWIRLSTLLRTPGGLRRADDGARLLAAEWALEDRDPARALTLLSELPPGVARRTQALRLRLRAARLSNQPQEALHTARLLAHHQAFSPEVARGLLRSLAVEALQEAHDVDQLGRIWTGLDTAERRDPLVAAHAAERAAGLGAPANGRGWLLPHWQNLTALEDDERLRLARALVQCVDGIGADWLPTLESAAAARGHEPAVQVAVGTAFAERELWGKARALLEPAARTDALPADLRRLAWRRLALLAREQADETRALEYDRAAASLGD
jgi:HemY protein